MLPKLYQACNKKKTIGCTSIFSVRSFSLISVSPSLNKRLHRVPVMFSSDGWGFLENVDICGVDTDSSDVCFQKKRMWAHTDTMTAQTDLGDDVSVLSKLRLQRWEWREFDELAIFLGAQHNTIEVGSFVAKGNAIVSFSSLSSAVFMLLKQVEKMQRYLLNYNVWDIHLRW